MILVSAARLAPAVAVFVLLAPPARLAAEEIAVTACGQEIPRRTTGYLTGDLDCTGTGGTNLAAVVLHDRASLDLRGFTLTADDHGVACLEPCAADPSAYCQTRGCRVLGGTITGGSEQGVHASARRVEIDDVSITGFQSAGIFNAGTLTLRNVTLAGNGVGLAGIGVAKLQGTTIAGNGAAGSTIRLARVRFSDVTGNGAGLSAERIVLIGSTALGNGPYDIEAARKPRVVRGSR
jgi:hypothetical protein